MELFYFMHPSDLWRLGSALADWSWPSASWFGFDKRFCNFDFLGGAGD